MHFGHNSNPFPLPNFMKEKKGIFPSPAVAYDMGAMVHSQATMPQNRSSWECIFLYECHMSHKPTFMPAPLMRPHNITCDKPSTTRHISPLFPTQCLI